MNTNTICTLKNYEATCPSCGKTRTVSYYIHRRIVSGRSDGSCRFCSHVGHLGKKHSDEAKKKMIKSRTGMKRSLETRRRMSFNQLGSKNSCWRGGFSDIKDLIRSCSRYKEWRNCIFARDKWTCTKCGAVKTRFEAHHIKKLLDIVRKYNIKTIEEAMECFELWDTENGVTLCKRCHKKIHKRQNDNNKEELWEIFGREYMIGWRVLERISKG